MEKEHPSSSSSSAIAVAKGRLFSRLASFLVAHAHVVSVACCVAGLVGLLLLPPLAKTTHVSENALIPGSAKVTFSDEDAMNAHEVAVELQSILQSSSNLYLDFQSWLFHYFDLLGVDYCYQSFWPQNGFHSPLQFISHHGIKGSPPHNTSTYDGNVLSPGINLVGIVRAPRGDGNEAIVLVTPFDLKKLAYNDAISLGLSLVLLKLLTRAHWLAKDVIWLAADAQFGAYTAVDAWLKEYHQSTYEYSSLPYKANLISNLQTEGDSKASHEESEWLDDLIFEDFKRAGAISAAFVVTFSVEGINVAFDTMQIKAEGSNGQMPNLDLINVVTTLATYRPGLQLKLDSFQSILSWPGLRIVGDVLKNLGTFLEFVYPDWGFSSSALEYVQGAATLLCSVWKQALGIPTGPHGAFRDYQLDAVTLEIFSGTNSKHTLSYHDLLLNTGRLLEGAIRSVNNLLEKFHHSVFLYFLVSPTKFLPISIYGIPFALLVITLPLQAAALCSRTSAQSNAGIDKESKLNRNMVASFNWIKSIQIVTLVELWSIGTSLMPIPLSLLTLSSEAKVVVWAVFACATLVAALYTFSILIPSSDHSDGMLKSSIILESDFIAIKALTLGLAAIFLGVMSAVNFALALLGVLLVLPICLFAQPLGHVKSNIFTVDRFCLHSFLAMTGTFVTIFLSAPNLLLAYIVLGGPWRTNLQQLWIWTESLWFWGSASYLFGFLIYLPCSVLCILLVFWCS